MNSERIDELIKNKNATSSSYKILSDAGITFVIRGSIIELADNYRIDVKLINTSDKLPLYSSFENVEDISQLGKAVGILAKRVRDFIYVKVLHYDSDLRNWWTEESINYEALKKFQLAKDQIFRMIPADNYLMEAIKLDSTFVSPRIWLIPKLVRTNPEEAKKQYAVLKTLFANANPFEREMIDYAGAFIKKDLLGQAYHLRNAIDYSPGDLILIYNLADVLKSLCNYQEALETLQPCLKIKWGFPPTYGLAAACYIKLNKINEAKNILVESLSLPTRYINNFALLSVIYWRLGELENSKKYENLALGYFSELKVPIENVYKLLSDFYSDLGLYDKALEKINESIKIKPDESLFLARKAEIFFRKGDYVESKIECLKAIKSSEPAPRAYLVLGQIYDKEGNSKLAIENYKSFYAADSFSCDAVKLKQRLNSKSAVINN